MVLAIFSRMFFSNVNFETIFAGNPIFEVCGANAKDLYKNDHHQKLFFKPLIVNPGFNII